MASEKQALLLSMLTTLTFFTFTIKSSSHDTKNIVIYWGKNSGDGSLSATCDSGNYDMVLVSSLDTFGEGRTPQLNLTNHCGYNTAKPCYVLQSQIEHCQSIGVKVFLSLGGPTGEYSLTSEHDAEDVANYVHSNFLSGKNGPLGKVTLDGIDLDIQLGDDTGFWEHLVRELVNLKKLGKEKFELSAAPQCNIPDTTLDTAIKTGLFEYVFVHFYNNPPCQFDSTSGSPTSLIDSWNDWMTLMPLTKNKVFLGIPAASEAAPNGGFMTPKELTDKVLPFITQSPNYGGVMLWDRHLDITNHYSDNIGLAALPQKATISLQTYAPHQYY